MLALNTINIRKPDFPSPGRATHCLMTSPPRSAANKPAQRPDSFAQGGIVDAGLSRKRTNALFLNIRTCPHQKCSSP